MICFVVVWLVNSVVYFADFVFWFETDCWLKLVTCFVHCLVCCLLFDFVGCVYAASCVLCLLIALRDGFVFCVICIFSMFGFVIIVLAL